MSSDIANYADDITPYECAPYYDKLKKNGIDNLQNVLNWFKYKTFIANATKCHFFLSPYQSATINIDV